MVNRLDTFRVFAGTPGSRSLKLVGIYPTFSAAKDRAELIHITQAGVRCRIRVPRGQERKWANQSFVKSDTMSLFPRYARYSEEGPRWTFLSERQMMNSVNSVYMM
jgi:hypothetical protein